MSKVKLFKTFLTKEVKLTDKVADLVIENAKKACTKADAHGPLIEAAVQYMDKFCRAHNVDVAELRDELCGVEPNEPELSNNHNHSDEILQKFRNWLKQLKFTDGTVEAYCRWASAYLSGKNDYNAERMPKSVVAMLQALMAAENYPQQESAIDVLKKKRQEYEAQLEQIKSKIAVIDEIIASLSV